MQKRILLIDDEAHVRRAISRLLADSNPEVTVAGEADSVAEGLRLIREIQPDAVFLDIKMKDGSGFDLLDQLPEINFQLIFLTAYDQYAVKAFQYHAIHYLLKPVDPDELTEAIRRITHSPQSKNTLPAGQLEEFLKSFRTRRLDRLSIPTQRGTTFLRLSEIIQLESEGNYTYLFSNTGGKIMASRPLRDFEKLLPADDFFRTHQSHIVNLDHVRMVVRKDGGLFAQMTDRREIPVARRKREEFMEKLDERSL